MPSFLQDISNIDLTNYFSIMPIVIVALTLSPQVLFMFKPSWELVILGKKAQNKQYIAAVIFLYAVILIYNFSPLLVADSAFIPYLAICECISIILLFISFIMSLFYR